MEDVSPWLLLPAALVTWEVFVWWLRGHLRQRLPQCKQCGGVCLPNHDIQRFQCENCGRIYLFLRDGEVK